MHPVIHKNTWLYLHVLGIAAALVVYPFMLAAITLSPWFNLSNSSLSALGDAVSNGWVGYIYSTGIGLAGLLTLAFAVLLSYKSRNRRVLIWTVPLAATSVCLAMIGVFSEGTPGPYHHIATGLFFLLDVVTLLAFSCVPRPFSSTHIRVTALVFGIFSAFIWITYWPWSGIPNQWSVWPWSGDAILEAATALMTSVWLILVVSRT